MNGWMVFETQAGWARSYEPPQWSADMVSAIAQGLADRTGRPHVVCDLMDGSYFFVRPALRP